MSLGRDQILKVVDIKIQAIEVPEWGGSVCIRTLTAGQRDRFECRAAKHPENDLRAYLAVMVLCDEEGNPLFNDADIPVLTAKSSSALDRFFATAVKFNKISKEDVDGLRKNS